MPGERAPVLADPVSVPHDAQGGDALCAALSRLHHLRRLDLRGQSAVTLRGLASLSALQHLQSLSLGGCPAICDLGLQLIACHTGLRQLSLQQATKDAAPLHEGECVVRVQDAKLC